MDLLRQFLRRYGLAVIAVAVFALLATSAASVLLAWSSHRQVQHAQQQADRFEAQFRQTQIALHDLCVRRETLERNLRAVEQADVTLQRRQIRLQRRGAFIAAALLTEEIAVLRAKETADRVYLATPVEDGCEALLPR